MLKYCPECGTGNELENKFCVKCGKKLIIEIPLELKESKKKRSVRKSSKKLEKNDASGDEKDTFIEESTKKERPTETMKEFVLDEKSKIFPQSKKDEFFRHEYVSYVLIGIMAILTAFVSFISLGLISLFFIPSFSLYTVENCILFFCILSVIYFLMGIYLISRSKKGKSGEGAILSSTGQKKKAIVKNSFPKNVRKKEITRTKKIAIIVPIVIIVSVALFFVIDFEPPSISITSLSDGDIVPARETIIKGIASDNDEIQKIEISINNGTWEEVSYSNFEKEWEFESHLFYGDNTIVVRAIDKSGNTAATPVLI